MNWEGCRSSHGLFQGNLPACAWRHYRKTIKISVSVVTVKVKNQIQNELEHWWINSSALNRAEEWKQWNVLET